MAAGLATAQPTNQTPQLHQGHSKITPQTLSPGVCFQLWINSRISSSSVNVSQRNACTLPPLLVKLNETPVENSAWPVVPCRHAGWWCCPCPRVHGACPLHELEPLQGTWLPHPRAAFCRGGGVGSVPRPARPALPPSLPASGMK